MRVLILGGVAAGTKTAAKLKREDRSAEVILLSKSKDISYAGCGLPYFVGGAVEDEEELIVNTPKKFAALTGVEVHTGVEALEIDPVAKCVQTMNLDTGAGVVYTYDKLVIATGASPLVPPLEGVGLEGVFTVRTPQDASAMRAWVRKGGVRSATVVGGGFIGLEMAENLLALGLEVTVLEAAPQLLFGILDSEMADYVRRHLIKKGIRVRTGTAAKRLGGNGRIQTVETDTETLESQMAVLAVGIRPNTDFLQGSGLIMERGRVVVDDHLRTNLPDVYAVGDCAQVYNRITGAPQWSPMGSSANLEGRTLARILAGREDRYPGVLGTGVVLLPGLNCGRTGLTQAQAEAAGYDVESVLAITDDKAHYYPDAGFFATKLIAERATHRLLGLQVLGTGAVDKMVDIAVTALNANAVLEDFDNGDYAYAPPFSTAIHPFVQAVYVLENKLNGELVSMTPAQYAAGEDHGYRILDVSPTPSIPGATFVELNKVNGSLPGIDKDAKLLLICVRGKRGYLLQNRLKYYGYTNTVVLEGAASFNVIKKPE